MKMQEIHELPLVVLRWEHLMMILLSMWLESCNSESRDVRDPKMRRTETQNSLTSNSTNEKNCSKHRTATKNRMTRDEMCSNESLRESSTAVHLTFPFYRRTDGMSMNHREECMAREVRALSWQNRERYQTPFKDREVSHGSKIKVRPKSKLRNRKSVVEQKPTERGRESKFCTRIKRQTK